MPPEPQHSQDRPQERLAALTMPPWFPRGLLPGGVEDRACVLPHPSPASLGLKGAQMALC